MYGYAIIFPYATMQPSHFIGSGLIEGWQLREALSDNHKSTIPLNVLVVL
ncbi:MAG: hypothetical protein ACI81V_000417 [Lentimonas sp.]|jgi:hypothetical protein